MDTQQSAGEGTGDNGGIRAFSLRTGCWAPPSASAAQPVRNPGMRWPISKKSVEAACVRRGESSKVPGHLAIGEGSCTERKEYDLGEVGKNRILHGSHATRFCQSNPRPMPVRTDRSGRSGSTPPAQPDWFHQSAQDGLQSV